MKTDVGQKLQILRKRCSLSIRKLAELSGITPGMISCIERNKTSPSIATLRKILTAMESDLAAFFADETVQDSKTIFARERMQTISDRERSYTIILPKRDDIGVEILDENFYPTDVLPEFETLECDITGYVLCGNLKLEISG